MAPTHNFRIESLLAARLFLVPQLVDGRIYFISDLSGRLSLYAMDDTGSVPECLLPPSVALQNPHLISGYAFVVLERLNRILVMIDRDGDENYQPMFVPLDGGIPTLVFGDRFAGQQIFCIHCDTERNLALFTVDPRSEPIYHTLRVVLSTLEEAQLGSSPYHNVPIAVNEDYTDVILADQYTAGDAVLYRWRRGDSDRALLYGTPLTERATDEGPHLTGFGVGEFVSQRGLLLTTSLFDDQYGLGYLDLDAPDAVQPVEIVGIRHEGVGELVGLEHLEGERYRIDYNIDGCSWVYAGVFDEGKRRFTIERTVCGSGALSNGVLESLYYDKESARYVASFSTATSPAQLYIIGSVGAGGVTPLTRERVLGIEDGLLAAGEDASYTSHDGLRISARLYLPAASLGYSGPRPVAFYIHGGPQSQERPDFTWFSMPLIQFLTLHGIAVFVPNVRGSTGYGMAYMKQVDHDWGGRDRLDHVAAFEHLRADARLDPDRAAVVGRSYGGYMTLTLAGRHPDLWRAACDMFGPFNLFTFMERLPPTWRTYFYAALGHPERDRDFLIERSPNTYLGNLACPLLVIQGANDPRVVEGESSDLVADLRAAGKTVEYLVFENEGHDVIKFENKVRCYNRITDFFVEQLQP